MTQAEYTERYLKFMKEYDAQLPAEMPEEERREKVLAALEDFFADDLKSQIDHADEDIQNLFDDAMVQAENATENHDTAQLAAVRQSL